MKRGSSGLSLVVAVNKPKGLTSHDVVNRCRSIFEERRVGHTGTLDPLATGVLPICIGPATRLDRFLTGHDKTYRVTMRFGFETTTDDCEGEQTVAGKVPSDLAQGDFAPAYIAGLKGVHQQVPPRYSSIKVNGKKAYEQARKGAALDLPPRPIEVYEARLVSRDVNGSALTWTIDFSVSKGTYIRALVRDIGRELGCPAHVQALERQRSGTITLGDCVSLASLEGLKQQAALDPVRALGFKVAFADDVAKSVEAGGKLSAARTKLYEFAPRPVEMAQCSCMGSVSESCEGLEDGEFVSVVVENRLKAVYRFDSERGALVPDCVFAIPVSRM